MLDDSRLPLALPRHGEEARVGEEPEEVSLLEEQPLDHGCLPDAVLRDEAGPFGEEQQDRVRLNEAIARFQLQDRNAPEAVDLGEGRRLVRALGEVEGSPGERDPEVAQDQADLPSIAGQLAIVERHHSGQAVVRVR